MPAPISAPSRSCWATRICEPPPSICGYPCNGYTPSAVPWLKLIDRVSENHTERTSAVKSPGRAMRTAWPLVPDNLQRGLPRRTTQERYR
jgi:hypothetical protein